MTADEEHAPRRAPTGSGRHLEERRRIGAVITPFAHVDEAVMANGAREARERLARGHVLAEIRCCRARVTMMVVEAAPWASIDRLC